MIHADIHRDEGVKTTQKLASRPTQYDASTGSSESEVPDGRGSVTANTSRRRETCKTLLSSPARLGRSESIQKIFTGPRSKQLYSTSASPRYSRGLDFKHRYTQQSPLTERKANRTHHQSVRGSALNIPRGRDWQTSSPVSALCSPDPFWNPEKPATQDFLVEQAFVGEPDPLAESPSKPQSALGFDDLSSDEWTGDDEFYVPCRKQNAHNSHTMGMDGTYEPYRDPGEISTLEHSPKKEKAAANHLRGTHHGHRANIKHEQRLPTKPTNSQRWLNQPPKRASLRRTPE